MNYEEWNKELTAIIEKCKGTLTSKGIAGQIQLAGYRPIKAPELTKREAFAMAAMQGVWFSLSDGNRPQHYEYTAQSCVAMADALLAELDKEQSK